MMHERVLSGIWVQKHNFILGQSDKNRVSNKSVARGWGGNVGTHNIPGYLYRERKIVDFMSLLGENY